MDSGGFLLRAKPSAKLNISSLFALSYKQAVDFAMSAKSCNGFKERKLDNYKKAYCCTNMS